MKADNWIGRSRRCGIQRAGSKERETLRNVDRVKPRTLKLCVPMALLILLALALVSSPAATARGPNTHSSCMGQEAAGISPPGSSDEVPNGMPGLISFIKGLSPAPGAIVSYIASLHEGSHVACDELLG